MDLIEAIKHYQKKVADLEEKDFLSNWIKSVKEVRASKPDYLKMIIGVAVLLREKYGKQVVTSCLDVPEEVSNFRVYQQTLNQLVERLFPKVSEVDLLDRNLVEGILVRLIGGNYPGIPIGTVGEYYGVSGKAYDPTRTDSPHHKVRFDGKTYQRDWEYTHVFLEDIAKIRLAPITKENVLQELASAREEVESKYHFTEYFQRRKELLEQSRIFLQKHIFDDQELEDFLSQNEITLEEIRAFYRDEGWEKR